MDLARPSFKGRRRLLGAALALPAALAALALGSAAAPAAIVPACPGFRVLHNDRIGPANLPAGDYTLTLEAGSNLSCAAASKLFARFLEDYDGVLPRPWRVVAEGSGRAAFEQGGLGGFSVARSGGSGSGEREVNLLGKLCPNAFSVNANATVGPLVFGRGGYLLYIPPRSGISCNRAAVLFTRFLGAGGPLPPPWRLLNQTATFYKAGNPQRSAFRVEPVGGAGPA